MFPSDHCRQDCPSTRGGVRQTYVIVCVCSRQITVDTTAPLPGVVSDSEQSQADIDFQQDSTQHASWQGFFDRESSIMFYQYAFSDGCVSVSDFSVPPVGKVGVVRLDC